VIPAIAMVLASAETCFMELLANIKTARHHAGMAANAIGTLVVALALMVSMALTAVSNCALNPVSLPRVTLPAITALAAVKTIPMVSIANARMLLLPA